MIELQGSEATKVFGKAISEKVIWYLSCVWCDNKKSTPEKSWWIEFQAKGIAKAKALRNTQYLKMQRSPGCLESSAGEQGMEWNDTEVNRWQIKESYEYHCKECEYPAKWKGKPGLKVEAPFLAIGFVHSSTNPD